MLPILQCKVTIKGTRIIKSQLTEKYWRHIVVVVLWPQLGPHDADSVSRELASPCRRRWSQRWWSSTSWRCPRGFAPTANVGFPPRAQHKESFSARISVRIHASTRNTSNTIYNMDDTNNTNSAEQARKTSKEHLRVVAINLCTHLLCKTHIVHGAYLLQPVQMLKNPWCKVLQAVQMYELCKLCNCASTAAAVEAKQGAQSLRPFQRKPSCLLR